MKNPQEKKSSAGALAGIKVVDLSRVLAGPYCTQMLGDHGATIIKVEPPMGDETRTWGPFRDGLSAYYNGINRNKRDLVLDISKPAGCEVVLRLLQDADVLVENFKIGTMEKWGLSWEFLAAQFPRLIYCRVSGFGSEGPLAGMPGYDAVAQAMGGMMSVNGETGGGPLRIGIPIADMATGMMAHSAVLLALVERATSGRGQLVEVSLLDTAVSLLHPHAASWFMAGERPKRTGNAHPLVTPYDVFQTATGPLFVGVGNDRQFGLLCAALNCPEVASDARFTSNEFRAQNRAALREILAAILLAKERDKIASELLKQGVPASVVAEVPETLENPQVLQNEMVVEIDGYRGLGVPVKLSRTPGAARSEPPVFGQHSRELLHEAGYSDVEVDAMIAQGVVQENKGR